jgi:nicotinamidase-related amidase
VTTLNARPNTALLVVDVQNDVVGEAHERDAVVSRVGGLVERARSEGAPVVWVQHSDEHIELGSDGWRIVSELTPAEDEALVHKTYGDAFEDTELETVLAGLAVGRLVVAGAETDACIRSDEYFVKPTALLSPSARSRRECGATGDPAWGRPSVRLIASDA